MPTTSFACEKEKEGSPEASPVGKLESTPVGRPVSSPVGRAERFEVKPVGSAGSPVPTGRPEVRLVGIGRVTGGANKVAVEYIVIGILGATNEVTPVGNAEVGTAGMAGTAGTDAPIAGMEALGSGTDAPAEGMAAMGTGNETS